MSVHAQLYSDINPIKITFFEHGAAMYSDDLTLNKVRRIKPVRIRYVEYSSHSSIIEVFPGHGHTVIAFFLLLELLRVGRITEGTLNVN